MSINLSTVKEIRIDGKPIYIKNGIVHHSMMTITPYYNTVRSFFIEGMFEGESITAIHFLCNKADDIDKARSIIATSQSKDEYKKTHARDWDDMCSCDHIEIGIIYVDTNNNIAH